MPSVFIYVVARDFGFAPNPFHGFCTLATCKPAIRGVAQVGDWVIGVGGARLGATGHLVYAMRVTEKVTFNEYWHDPRFQDKKPVRNGSRTMMIGDNIYRRAAGGNWEQIDSHHSNPDGTPNTHNLSRDTARDAVLVSSDFYYLGRAALPIPTQILLNLGFKNRIGHYRYSEVECLALLTWLTTSCGSNHNQVIADPYDFLSSQMRYLGNTNKIV